MEKCNLGNTGIKVSKIAFGGVEIGMPYGPNKKIRLSRKEAVKLLLSAVEKGINFFDTARAYGKSEEIMGEAFHSMRANVVLTTKCEHLPADQDFLMNREKVYQYIETSLNESLKALHTDYVDLFMLHQSSEKYLTNPNVLEAFNKLREKGLTRNIGASTYLPSETKVAIGLGIWNVIQVPFNLMDQRQAEYFDLANNKGIGIVLRSILFRGLLTAKGRKLHPKLRRVEDHIKKYGVLTPRGRGEISDLAINFALSFPHVSSVLIGIDRQEFLSNAIRMANEERLSEDVMKEARLLGFPDPEFLNLPLWDRNGWL